MCGEISKYIRRVTILGIFLSKIINEIRVVQVGIGEPNVASQIDDKGLEIDTELLFIASKPQAHRIVETA